MKKQSATIKIFLVSGDPSGLRTAEISNWTGKAIACPRNELNELLHRDEIDSPGIYILIGVDSESGRFAVYVGEAELLKNRIKGHSDKEFWNNLVMFFSKDENLTKAHVRYLEGRLIEQAQKADRALIMNSTKSGSKLPEPDTADMDIYFEKALQLLPILGVNQFIDSSNLKTSPNQILYRKIKGLVAKGVRTANGFIVFKNSQAVLEHRKSSKWSRKVRENLIDSGILIKKDDYFIFGKDYEFGSPSTAGAAVCGGADNGLISWKNSEGKSIKEIESEQSN